MLPVFGLMLAVFEVGLLGIKISRTLGSIALLESLKFMIDIVILLDLTGSTLRLRRVISFFWSLITSTTCSVAGTGLLKSEF